MGVSFFSGSAFSPCPPLQTRTLKEHYTASGIAPSARSDVVRTGGAEKPGPGTRYRGADQDDEGERTRAAQGDDRARNEGLRPR
jgi:hypothetical protein